MAKHDVFTIATLFDHSQSLIVALNSNAKVIRRRENNATYYYKEYVDYHNNSSAQREVLISSRLKSLTYVWKADTDTVTELRQYLRTKDAGLDVIDWVNIRPYDYPQNSLQLDLPPLTGVLQEATQFIYLIHYCLLALKDIHSFGVVHLDIKPDNICIPANKRNGKFFLDFTALKLIDFDMAVSRDIPLTTPISLKINANTNLYQAPRLKSAINKKDTNAQNNLDFGVDLYALGIMLKNILSNYDNQLYSSYSMPAHANKILLDKLKSIVDMLLIFEDVEENTTDTHDSLLRITTNIIEELKIPKNANKFDFNINLNQLYNWDKRIFAYNRADDADYCTDDMASDLDYKPDSLDVINRHEIIDNLSRDNNSKFDEFIEINQSDFNSEVSHSSATNSLEAPFVINKQDPFNFDNLQKQKVKTNDLDMDESGQNFDDRSLVQKHHMSLSRFKIMFTTFFLMAFIFVGYLLWLQINENNQDEIIKGNTTFDEPPTAQINEGLDNDSVNNPQLLPETKAKTPTEQKTQLPIESKPTPYHDTENHVKQKPEIIETPESKTQQIPEAIPHPSPLPETVQKPRPTPNQDSERSRHPNLKPAPVTSDITIDNILDGEIVQAPVEPSQINENTDDSITIDDILLPLE